MALMTMFDSSETMLYFHIVAALTKNYPRVMVQTVLKDMVQAGIICIFPQISKKQATHWVVQRISINEQPETTLSSALSERISAFL